MKVLVKILPKPEVLDSAGRATFSALKPDFKGLLSCSLGKLIVLEFSQETSKDQALEDAKKMASDLLYNPLIEQCEYEVL